MKVANSKSNNNKLIKITIVIISDGDLHKMHTRSFLKVFLNCYENKKRLILKLQSRNANFI